MSSKTTKIGAIFNLLLIIVGIVAGRSIFIPNEENHLSIEK